MNIRKLIEEELNKVLKEADPAPQTPKTFPTITVPQNYIQKLIKEKGEGNENKVDSQGDISYVSKEYPFLFLRFQKEKKWSVLATWGFTNDGNNVYSYHPEILETGEHNWVLSYFLKNIKSFPKEIAEDLIRISQKLGIGTAYQGRVQYVKCSDPTLIVIYQQWLKYIKGNKKLVIDGAYGPQTHQAALNVLQKDVKQEEQTKLEAIIQQPSMVCGFVKDELANDGPNIKKNELETVLAKVGQKLGVKPIIKPKPVKAPATGTTTESKCPPQLPTKVLGTPSVFDIYGIKYVVLNSSMPKNSSQQMCINLTDVEQKNDISDVDPQAPGQQSPPQLVYQVLPESKSLRGMILKELMSALK